MLNLNFILIIILSFIIYKNNNNMKININLLIGTIFFIYYIYPYIINIHKQEKDEFTNNIKKYL